MSYKFGEIAYYAEQQDKPEHFIGDIACKVFQGRIALTPNPSYKDVSHPKFIIKEKIASTWYETGNAWLKESDKVNGGYFLSMTLDNPELDKPIYLTAYPQDDNASIFDVKWSRPKSKQQD